MFLCQHPEVMSGTTVTRTLSHEMEVGKIITATIQITEESKGSVQIIKMEI